MQRGGIPEGVWVRVSPAEWVILSGLGALCGHSPKRIAERLLGWTFGPATGCIRLWTDVGWTPADGPQGDMDKLFFAHSELSVYSPGFLPRASSLGEDWLSEEIAAVLNQQPRQVGKGR